MIVQREALIVPRGQIGWMPNVYNYQLPGGEFGMVPGVVGRVPVGTEIDLSRSADTLSVVAGRSCLGSIELLAYKPPSYVAHIFTLSSRYLTPTKARPVISTGIAHNSIFTVRGGVNIDPSLVPSNDAFGGTYFGKFSSFYFVNSAGVLDPVAGTYDVQLIIETMRSCLLRVESIGNGSFDFGAMDAYFDGGSVQATRCNNLFTNAVQVLPSGAVFIAGGTVTLWFRFRYSIANGPGTKQFAKLRADFEVPYGV